MTVLLILWLWWSAFAGVTLSAALISNLLNDLSNPHRRIEARMAIVGAVAIGSLTTGATLCAITAWGLS